MRSSSRSGTRSRQLATASRQRLEAGVLQHPEAKPGPHARLRVIDSGAGIAAEHLPHIFEPFFTTKDVGKGTGLGLATVFGIVQQHGGWVQVASEPSRGTRFDIFFPLVARTQQDGAGVATRRPAGAERADVAAHASGRRRERPAVDANAQASHKPAY